MTTNQQRTNRSGASARAAAKRRKNKKKLIVFTIEIIIILFMIAGLYFALNTSNEGPKVTVLDPEQLAIPQEIQQAKEEGDSSMLGYMNIALFGVDATNEKELTKSSRSDSTMIASINMDTGDIKLVSVYRDTYLNIGTDEYRKCNAAYSKGGAKQAVKMLNMNLDMDIQNFVAVGYNGLMEVIDGLGGVYIDVDQEELKHINSYQISIVAQWKYGLKLTEETKQSEFEVVKKGDYIPVTETGYQLLNGLQATAYCRIRYTAGDDYKRAERQREVIKAIEAQAKKASLTTLTKVFNDAIGDVYTSLDINDLKDLLPKIADYKIVGEDGFPQSNMRVSDNIGAKGSCVVPQSLESNVVWLHQFLFDDTEYTVTGTVKDISDKIKADTDPYIHK